MHQNQKKEQFNIAFVRALAAQAGHNIGEFEVDDDSIDILFTSRLTGTKFRSPQINVQLKCTSGHTCDGKQLNFPLKRKNYDDLRGSDILVPRYLAVLVVPKNDEDWIEHGDSGILLKGECYWHSLRYLEETANDTKVTINIPAKQRLTAASLTDLLTLAGDGKYI